MNTNLIAKSSPLYKYWHTSQNDSDEQERLLMINNTSSAVLLFKNEPYKWEILYQSIVREIIKGDVSSIKGFKILIDTLNQDEQIKIIKRLENIKLIDHNIIKLIQNFKSSKTKSKKNYLRAFRILFSIFINPYKIEVKRSKNHLYEKTGAFFLRLNRFFNF
tara:strand:- start:3917 stop:4402 length:486 start_codon:yes stop_codon:yes gene_type:complete